MIDQLVGYGYRMVREYILDQFFFCEKYGNLQRIRSIVIGDEFRSDILYCG